VNARPDARAFEGAVVRRDVLSDHLVRIVLDGLDGFATTGVPDEWVALTVPGQFQTRYYTVRAWDGSELTLDVVVHEHGLVTEWAQGECVGDVVGISAPKGSFDVPAGAAWVVVVGDLTALPSIESYLDASVTWLDPPAPGESVLAELVEGLDWPAGDGYFWMAGESAQMRAIRRHLRHDLGMPSSAYDVMGYWSGSRGRQARAVDPRPIYAAGRAAGKSDEEIWDDYDAARGVTGG